MNRLRVSITGIVQGVGFRPFVYNLAKRHNLAGWVLNNSSGVQLEAEGEAGMLEGFVAGLQREAPPLAEIHELITEEVPVQGQAVFEIRQSLATTRQATVVSPDIAICPDCRREMSDPDNRRFAYPFTNCTNCGPRYSIVEDVPYDRVRTTMKAFSMCPSCQVDYDNPQDRRFHAQPNACPVCGPTYRLLSKEGESIIGDPIVGARRLIQAGAIMAIKGIGGYHLACNARDDGAVGRLRSRKIREAKPFAVMGGNLATVKGYCNLSADEEKLLTGHVSPIVLLRKGSAYDLAENVAPGNPWLGVMLPYAPVHHLLLKENDVWVMTSGNTSEEPIAYLDEDAAARLANIADYFLVHNRPIKSRSDDSVARVIDNRPYILRRARGLAPAPLYLKQAGPSVLACGGELKNAFCLTKGNKAFLSSHIGDLENMATFDAYTETIEHYKRLFEIKPQVVAYDLHPEYFSTKYADALELPKVAVQHHHAHIAGVLAEHGITEKVIGVAFDGTGYGDDGNLWGGEFLLADCRDFTRLAHCRYLRLPGGSKAIKEPWRLAAWMLYELFGEDFVNSPIPLNDHLPEGWQLLLQSTQKGINSPWSSGAGRLFDIAAAILGIGTRIYYEGQAAVELELAAAGARGHILPYDITSDSVRQLDFRPTFAAMVDEIKRGTEKAVLAASFHRTVAAAVVDMTKMLSKLAGIRKVALSGGVFQNILLLQLIKAELEKDFTVLLHNQVPPNDGGLALGQAAVAIERSK